ncbi:MAG: PucR family transcriptional regulator [Haloechinothrix sp.]
MPVSLRDLVADRNLGARALAGESALDRAVAWVHVSELDDPTPFLQGGELLLTTGLGMGRGTDFGAFVDRLAGSAVAALGFGTGLSHHHVPARLVRAAREHDLPLLEIPHRTPFIAISKAVSAALAADDYAEVTTTNDAQQALTKAALGKSGQAGLVRRLAHLLGAWVLFFGGAGHLVHAAPASAARRASEVSAEIDRLRGRTGRASATFAMDGDHVSVQALGGRPRTFLAVGRPSVLGRTDQHILNSAVALLTLALVRSQSFEAAQRHLRTGLMRLVLAGQVDAARRAVADMWGALPSGPVRVLACAGAREAREAYVDVLDAESDACFFAELGDKVVVLAADADVGHLQGLASQVANLRVGISEPVGYPSVADGHRQAVRSVEGAQRIGARAMHFADLSGEGLLRLVRPADASAFSESLLGPLIRHDLTGRGDLVVSLREWLRQHGQWDPAAARLGVHRHTLRNRIGKIEELLGVSLDSPGTRAELWLALQVVDPG